MKKSYCMNGFKSFIFLLVLGINFSSCILIKKDTLYQKKSLYDSGDYNRLTGWYQYTDSICAYLTYSAKGGLVLISTEDTLIKQDFVPKENEKWVWVREDQNREVTFNLDSPKYFEWSIPSEGILGKVKRCEGPYKIREVEYYNDSIKLSGNFFIPDGEGPFPGAVFIHGSGTSDRNNLWNFMFADFLARNGYAVLLPDKRGSGKSSGEWRVSSMSDLAQDVKEGLHFMESQKSIDSFNLGVIGFSQGGKIAPLVHQYYDDLAFIINISGSTVSFNEALKFESKHNLKEMGFPGFLASAIQPIATSMAKKRRPIWWKKNGDYTPIDYWKKNDEVPVLMLFGEEDTNAPVEKSVRAVNNIMEQINLDNITVKTFPEAGHGLFRKDINLIRDDVRNTLIDWLFIKKR